jgi:hypothetical protein
MNESGRNISSAPVPLTSHEIRTLVSDRRGLGSPLSLVIRYIMSALPPIPPDISEM